MIQQVYNCLKKTRKSKNLTIAEMCEGICSKRHCIRLENNECELNITYLYYFVQKLEVSIEDLIEMPSIESNTSQNRKDQL